jgi:murein DD-endopeptidase MepM/ murein hydrolase activator NlpD
MKKVKYYYDAENLAYRKIKPRKRKSLGYAALFLFASALFGGLCFIVLMNTSFLETPKDKLNSRELDNLKIRFSILNNKINQMEEVLGDVEERDNNIYRSYFNAAGLDDEEREGKQNAKRYKELEGYDNSQLVMSTTKKIDLLAHKLAVQSKSLDEIVKLAKAKNNLLAAIPAIQPVRNENLLQMASGFGYRTDPFTKIRKFHAGMDFSAPKGAPVFATGDGVIERADAGSSGYGNHIVIRHGFGYETLYAHLSKYNCRVGQRIKRGDIIGFVGSTGRSEGPHCHYEVHKNGEAVNPLNFYYGNISAAEYVQIAKQSNQENQSLD